MGEMSDTIGSCAELHEVYPQPDTLSLRKELDHLDHYCREFIRLSPPGGRPRLTMSRV
jgi:hypothetical protein